MSNKIMRLPHSDQTLYLIDISSFIFRAFFAIRSLKNSVGEPTNAVYGVATMIAKLVEEAKPQYMAVIYDSKEPSFREKIYPQYKANRSKTPEDLVPQLSRIEELIRSFEIHSYRQEGIEADDLISTLTHRWCEASPESQVVIVSSDKDLMQLVNDRVILWDTMKSQFYGIKQVEEKFGVRPDQIRDYLALVGDSADNIPGVSGIGSKGAAELLKQYGDLNQILLAAQEGKISGKKGEILRQEEKNARLSALLATLKHDLEVEVPVSSLRYQFRVNAAGMRILQELEFHSLVKKWSHFNKEAPSWVEVEHVNSKYQDRFFTIDTQKKFDILLEKIAHQGYFAVDLETTSLNPREAKIVGIAICHDPEFGFYIPVGHQEVPGESLQQLPKEQVLKSLKPFLENPKFKKIGQNLKYDWSVLRCQGIQAQGIVADTMVAAYVLEPAGRHNLQTLADFYLGYSVQTYEEVCGAGKDQLQFDQVSIEKATRYSAEDAWVAFRLWEVLQIKLDQEKLTEIFYQVDLPLVQVLSEMECQGVWIDVPWLNQLSQEFGQELALIEKKIQAYLTGPVNLNSPKQLAKLLFEELKLPTQGKTKTGFSTDAGVLEVLAKFHEVPRLLLEYREISKLKGTYVDPLPRLRDTQTGKIHASFHQTVTATGRLSSSNPNLQNIPIRSSRGMKIRKAFIPSDGQVIVSADYSQIELRLLAHLSQDPELVRAFECDEDVHQKTASEIFRVPLEQVNKQQRSVAKAINFGLMYGKTPYGLSQELGISRKEAQEMIHRYFEKYHTVKDYLDRQIKDAQNCGYVTTVLGRKRLLPELHSRHPAVRNNAERMAMNTPIQGTAADIMKLAMIDIYEQLLEQGFRSRLMIQVHDEVVLDCPVQELESVKKLIREAMENRVLKKIPLSVPLRVNLGVGKNWLELF